MVCKVTQFAESGDRLRSQSWLRPDSAMWHHEFTQPTISSLL